MELICGSFSEPDCIVALNCDGRLTEAFMPAAVEHRRTHRTTSLDDAILKYQMEVNMKANASSKSPKATAAGTKVVAAKGSPAAEKDDAEPVAGKLRATSVKKASKAKKVKPGKDVTCSFKLPEGEYEALQELRGSLGGALDRKVKKSELLRVAARIILNQTPAKIKAELAKISAE